VYCASALLDAAKDAAKNGMAAIVMINFISVSGVAADRRWPTLSNPGTPSCDAGSRDPFPSGMNFG